MPVVKTNDSHSFGRVAIQSAESAKPKQITTSPVDIFLPELMLNRSKGSAAFPLDGMSEKKLKLLNEMSQKGILQVSDRVDLMRADFDLRKQIVNIIKRDSNQGKDDAFVGHDHTISDEEDDSEPRQNFT